MKCDFVPDATINSIRLNLCKITLFKNIQAESSNPLGLDVSLTFCGTNLSFTLQVVGSGCADLEPMEARIIVD